MTALEHGESQRNVPWFRGSLLASHLNQRCGGSEVGDWEGVAAVAPSSLWRAGHRAVRRRAARDRPWAVLVALVVTAGTTWCCAARWSLLSARLGAPVPMRTAYVAYYRSQLVNATLPGGVVGDVDRGLRHGWRGGIWDRGLGQHVQVALVLGAGAALAVPMGRAVVALAAGLAVTGGAVVLLSAGAVAGHLVVFLAAATAAGVSLSPLSLLPVGALVLLGSAIPLNVAGWGPREGVAAWAFAAAGFDRGGRADGRRDVRGARDDRHAARAAHPEEDPPCLTGPTHCSRAGCRSTGSSTTPPTHGCSSPTTRTSTASTRCAPAATRSWSAPPRSATTTRGCWSARPSASRTGVRRDDPGSP